VQFIRFKQSVIKMPRSNDFYLINFYFKERGLYERGSVSEIILLYVVCVCECVCVCGLERIMCNMCLWEFA